MTKKDSIQSESSPAKNRKSRGAGIRIFTAQEVAALKPSPGKNKTRASVETRWGGGLALEARADREVKPWVYRYALGGRGGTFREMVLGHYPSMKLAEAREAHRQAVVLVRQGIDPVADKAAKLTENLTDLTMGALAERWLDYLVTTQAGRQMKESTIKNHAWRWHKYLAPNLKGIMLSSVSRQHLAAALDTTRKKSAEETRKGLSTLNLMLDFALARGLINENPARMLRPKDFAATSGKPRERYLSLGELLELWKALDASTKNFGAAIDGARGLSRAAVLTPTIAIALKLVILTGCRRSEVTGMAWGEVDLAEGEWKIPVERSKNGVAHTVVLHPMAQELIKEMKMYSTSDWVFQSPLLIKGEIKPIHSSSLMGALRRLQGRVKTPPKYTPPLTHLEVFTVHDLRRTAATHWADRLGVEQRTVELMLNHVPADRLVRTYQRGRRIEQVREGWMAWGDLLLEMLGLNEV